MGTTQVSVLSPRSLLKDPALRVLGAITAAGFVLFLIFDGQQTRLAQTFWAFQVPLDAALALGGWRLRQAAPARFRRFWTMITFAGVSFTIGDSYHFLHTLFAAGVPSSTGGSVQTAFFAVGMSSNVIACLIFPQGLRTGREKFVFWLDATTVLVGGSVMAWCFAVNPIGDAHTDRVTASVTAALVIVAAFSATKVALIPEPPMARIAAWPMVGAALLQGVSAFLPGPFQEQDHAYGYALWLLPSLFIAAGPRIQEIVVRVGAHSGTAKRRPYSLLPYGMIALTFLVFFAMLPERVSSQLWGATAGVVVITCLVAGRQLVAFQDNMKLIRRLDVALNVLRDHEVLLRRQASFDGLTGLANRTHFSEELGRALAGLRTADEASVLLIDLDDFKTINDTMGHAAGDALLVTVAERLREAVGADDVVCRLGGDEFAVLLRSAGPATAMRTAGEILRGLAVPTEVQQHTIVTRASVGVAGASPGDEPSALLSNADIAMYEAKHRGKSTSVVYTDAMGARIGSEADLIRELAQAIESDQFSLVYQPIVRLDDMALTGVEALIRWNHPSRGLVSPIEFIPIAERTGQIVAIGAWALREACRQAADWRREFPSALNLTIGVNVAGRQLRTPGFADEVRGVLERTQLPAACLSIEVTETAVLDDEESHEAMLALRGLGVKLALDDFGTAASSLGLLLTCPVTTLKLDRSFVESITTVGRQSAVATAVSQMAHALEFSSVAEGIETDEQRELIQSLGYEYGQGYLFSRPLPPELMADLWAAAPRPARASAAAGR
ncbi:putative bifunctional diguanylate cyclase/phosphodiesterase [Actinoplanes friuliensis]|uniref:Diguanylate cyclase n=1 Tax=Actinoplanes friuliensis DSM 7358 TaxID=1246995 RepID=U5VXZ2_9ACTN|nr:bifunctional diguanylate cyclase/phosphodiesterase [Actinoplanes friuliensis]AGZ41754.1 diguanylate cyclase [Actinoplanes friuliensis DSM 7358]